MTDPAGDDPKAKSKAGPKGKSKAGPKAKSKAGPKAKPTAGPNDDPFEKVTAAFADAGERLVEYADVWRSAIARNAADDYAADDFLVDLQTMWGMSVRDVTRAGTAFVETMAPLLGSDAFSSRQDNTDADGGSTRST